MRSVSRVWVVTGALLPGAVWQQQFPGPAAAKCIGSGACCTPRWSTARRTDRGVQTGAVASSIAGAGAGEDAVPGQRFPLCLGWWQRPGRRTARALLVLVGRRCDIVQRLLLCGKVRLLVVAILVGWARSKHCLCMAPAVIR